MWNVRVIAIEIMARYIDSLSHERKSCTREIVLVWLFFFFLFFFFFSNKEAVWKHTPLICTMVSGIGSRVLKKKRRDEWPCEYGRFLIQPAGVTHHALISFEPASWKVLGREKRRRVCEGESGLGTI